MQQCKQSSFKKSSQIIIQALQYLESQNGIHEDIESTKILSQSCNIYIFITDFGSKKMDGSKISSYVCSKDQRAPTYFLVKYSIIQKLTFVQLVVYYLNENQATYYFMDRMLLIRLLIYLCVRNNLEKVQLELQILSSQFIRYLFFSSSERINLAQLFSIPILINYFTYAILIQILFYLRLFSQIKLPMKHYKSLLQFSQQKQNNSPKQLAFIVIGTLFAFSGYYVYYNVKYMDQIAAERIQEFEQKSGMKISEFKTENPIKEEIRPEYIERQKRIYRQKMEETRRQLQQQQK